MDETYVNMCINRNYVFSQNFNPRNVRLNLLEITLFYAVIPKKIKDLRQIPGKQGGFSIIKNTPLALKLFANGCYI